MSAFRDQAVWYHIDMRNDAEALTCRFYGTDIDALRQRVANIFIGISIGNKPFNTIMAKKYLEYALDNTKDSVLILIADNIDAINWIVFNGYSAEAAQRKVAEKGRQFEDMFRRAIRQLRHERKIRDGIEIHIARWGDILNEEYWVLHKKVKEYFQTDSDVRNKVMSYVDAYAKRRAIELGGESRERLSDYIISELPTLMHGVNYRGRNYDIILYPTHKNTGMSVFANELQGKVMPGAPVMAKVEAIIG